MSNEYVESVWWALRQIWDKGLLYEGHKVVPYCPRCGTALSSHEVALGYKDVSDPSLHVRFKVSEPGPNAALEPGDSLLVWTTTPWTLISNVAIAVSPDVDYLRLRLGDEVLVLAEPLVEKVLGDERGEQLGRFSGAALAGTRYEPLFTYVGDLGDKAYRVWPASFVTTEDGTGLVHIAPAFGEDDLAVATDNDLPVVNPVARRRHATTTRSPTSPAQFVKDADPAIIAALGERGLVFRSGAYEHSYPHCWRCDTPLLYYAKASWYVRTTAIRDELVANNEQIEWYPFHIKHGPLRQVAREQRRLGAVARALLGHAAADLALRGRARPLRRLATKSWRDWPATMPRRPAPSLHRRGHLRLRRVRQADARASPR